MEIKKTFKETIKIKDLACLNDLGAEIVEFYPRNDLLEGKLYVTGNYLSSKNDLEKIISYDIPFTIVFEDNNFLIEDIECISFNYNIIESFGFEIEFEINVKYSYEQFEMLNEEKNNPHLQIEQEVNDNLNEERNILNKVYEEVKDSISNEVDLKLSSKLNSYENYPQNEDIIRNISEKLFTIKIVYYHDDHELEQIANKNHCSLNNLFNQNRKNDINKFKRVIIKNG